MIKLYGTARSRANRCLSAQEELRLAYKQIPLNFGQKSHAPDFLAINPNGRVPVLNDGGTIPWESIAINLMQASCARRSVPR